MSTRKVVRGGSELTLETPRRNSPPNSAIKNSAYAGPGNCHRRTSPAPARCHRYRSRMPLRTLNSCIRSRCTDVPGGINFSTTDASFPEKLSALIMTPYRLVWTGRRSVYTCLRFRAYSEKDGPTCGLGPSCKYLEGLRTRAYCQGSPCMRT